MPLDPFDPDLEPTTRHDLAKRLRALLVDQPLDVRAMAGALEVEPEVIVAVMRELRARRSGRLRSKVALGHVSWWWEPNRPRKHKTRSGTPSPSGAIEGETPEAESLGAVAPPSGAPKNGLSESKASKKKGKRKGKGKKS